MDVVITTEYRFDRTPDGSVWTHTMFAHSFWLRYLSVFDNVCILARIRDIKSVPADYKRVDGEGVGLHPVPYYKGPVEYTRHAGAVKRAVQNYYTNDTAFILRVPSHLANLLYPVLASNNHPFGMEVVGDPYDVFAPGAVKHPLRSFLRMWFCRNLRIQCANACAVSYVTEFSLQKRYPPSPGAFTTHYSSIELSDQTFARSERVGQYGKDKYQLVTVASLEQLYKGTDILINAVYICIQKGLNISLSIIGDGKCRKGLERVVHLKGLSDNVNFVGQLPAGEAVYRQLDAADLFILPSRTEGLPRAMIEAMARALPCIGTNVGGIPELLPADCLVAPGDADALASKIQEFLTLANKLSQMSAKSLTKSKEYSDAVLNKRRKDFYSYINNETIKWVKSR